MSHTPDELTQAKALAKAARRDLTDTLADLQARLAPKSLVRDAAEKLKEGGAALGEDALDAVRAHPGRSAGAAAAMAALLLHRPLLSLFRRKPKEPRSRSTRSSHERNPAKGHDDD